MNLSQKCQYGLRAMFELAKRNSQGPLSIPQIAEAQAIPPRFLEQILTQLKHAGYVESRRGVQGGYLLASTPYEVTVGEIIRLFEGPLSPVKCLAGQGGGDCPLLGDCAFIELWERAQAAVEEVYDSTSLQDLIDRERAAAARRTVNFCI
ncbi:MAG TPA: Rrf2 family transcriptional regulator [Phycisphaerales bacterium]|nr:Rrf2 family transcriptional regulator [Phycisphaerales bacterium]